MPKKRTGGRPKKQKEEEQVEVYDKNYLQMNELAFQLIQLIAILANYKILTITGPKSEKNNKEKIERRKNVEDRQRQLKNDFKLEEDYVFFLKDIENTQKDIENTQKQYKLVNKKIVVELKEIFTQQQQNVIDEINHKAQSSKFFESVEMAFKYLNPSMQMILKIIIESYEESDKNQTSFEEKFFQKFNANPECFQELHQWDCLYEESFNEKILIQEEELKQFQTKFLKKGSDSKRERKESKVEKKRQQVIKAEAESIMNQKKLQSPHRPIKYLLHQLFPLLSQEYRIDEIFEF